MNFTRGGTLDWDDLRVLAGPALGVEPSVPVLARGDSPMRAGTLDWDELGPAVEAAASEVPEGVVVRHVIFEPPPSAKGAPAPDEALRWFAPDSKRGRPGV
jgi:hypothetical protein